MNFLTIKSERDYQSNSNCDNSVRFKTGKRVHNGTLKIKNFFELPTVLVQHFISFGDNSVFSLINHQIKKIADSARKSIHLNYFKNELSSQFILVNIIKRFPNVEQLYFKSDFPCDLIFPLVSHLEKSYPKKLSQLGLLEFYIKENPYEKELSQKFFNVFNNSQTTYLKIMTTFETRLTNEMVNSIFEKSKSLKSFFLHNRSEQLADKKDMEFLVSKCASLEKVSLTMPGRNSWNKTLLDLQNCRNLSTLILNCDDCTPIDKRRFSMPEGQKLKCLNVNGMGIDNDDALIEITMNLPNLEVFSNINCAPQYTKRGLIQLACHCPKLTILCITIENITDEGFCDFIVHIPNLKKLDLDRASDLTRKSISVLTHSCKQLRMLALSFFRDFDREILEEISSNCKEFEGIFIESNCRYRKIDFGDLRKFIRSCKSLKYLNFAHFKYNNRITKRLLKDFPHLKRGSFPVIDGDFQAT